MKSVIALIGSFVPVIYCGYLVYYFVNLSNWSLQEVEDNGLAPTVFGLAVVGLLFSIPLVVKLVLVFIALRKPRSGGGAGTGGAPHGGDGTFDADAVVARYLAQRQAETGSPSAPRTREGASTSRPSFGRKNR